MNLTISAALHGCRAVIFDWDTFLEAARRLDVDPGDCLAVEDAPDGVTAARRAGMRVLLVRDGQLAWPPADHTRPDQQGI
ncbi:MAG: HAD-IA family hydrolase [Pseudonocardia sp.]